MNKRSIIYILGWVLIVESVAMQIGTVTSLIYGEKRQYILWQRALCAQYSVCLP